MQPPASSPVPTQANSRWLIWLTLALAVVWLTTLGARKLLNPDEARYAEIPREMVATGDWQTPRLNDLDYFE
jgi:4-amino-4-deoxy-L-arabinose transferase-like glycosyltransferase